MRALAMEHPRSLPPLAYINYPGSTLLAEGEPRPVRGGGLWAATAAAMTAAAACDPVGSVLFEY